MSLTTVDFDYVRTLVRERSAIVLEPGKEYLVESRLLPLARREGFATLSDFMVRLRGQRPNGLQAQVVEALTTNETSFFRDLHPFDALRKAILPDLIARRADERKLSIWSAGCSSGQEIYSLAMLVKEHFPQLGLWEVRLLATDLSGAVLERALTGTYNQLEVNRGLPAPLLAKYFVQEGVGWQIKPSIRKMVEFRELNLAESWPPLPDMDVILLRNVLIYFGTETKKDILGKVRQVLRPDGCVILGASETTYNLDEAFEQVKEEKAWWYRLRAA